MKHIGKKICLYTLHIVSIGRTLFATHSFAITVSVPPSQGYQDYIISNETDIHSSTTDESFLFRFIQIVNRYLRFIMGGIAMGVFMYAGLKILTAEGDESKVKEGTTILIGTTVGVIIVILSYAIVRLVVNIL